MRRSFQRRGFVIVAVLVAGISGLWVATSLLFLAQSDVRSAEVTMTRTRNRSLGLSGLRMLSDVLVEQREKILLGDSPTIEPQYSLWDEGNREAVVRLIPFGPGGERLIAEAGRLDVNHATVEQLSRLNMLDSGQARAIVDAREARPTGRFHSLHELLMIDGIDAADLLGDLAEEDSMDQVNGQEVDLAERVARRLAVPEARGLIDVLTIFGFEPNLQQNGRRRIDLNVPWSEELARRITERFGEGAAAALESVFQETAFDDDARIVEVLRRFQVPARDWMEPLDALTTRPEVHVTGRLDLNTASVDVLETLPGLDRAKADRLVAERESLDREERGSIAWPLLRDVVSDETFEEISSLVTVRSWTWRVRIAAGMVAADDPEGPIDQAVVYEAVIDLADPQPRIGYLREITLLQTASRLAAVLEDERADEESAVAAFEENLPLDDFSMNEIDDMAITSLDDLNNDFELDDEFPEEPADPNQSPQSDEVDETPSGRIGRWRP